MIALRKREISYPLCFPEEKNNNNSAEGERPNLLQTGLVPEWDEVCHRASVSSMKCLHNVSRDPELTYTGFLFCRHFLSLVIPTHRSWVAKSSSVGYNCAFYPCSLLFLHVLDAPPRWHDPGWWHPPVCEQMNQKEEAGSQPEASISAEWLGACQGKRGRKRKRVVLAVHGTFEESDEGRWGLGCLPIPANPKKPHIVPHL